MILHLLTERGGKLLGTKTIDNGSLWSMEDGGFTNTALVDVEIKSKGNPTWLEFYDRSGKLLSHGPNKAETLGRRDVCRFYPGTLRVNLLGPS